MKGEAWKVKYSVIPYLRESGLDVGCGPYKVWPHVIGVDHVEGWKRMGVDVFGHADNLRVFGTDSVDFVFSSHCLEDLEDTVSVLREWWRVIRPGGHLVLYLPHRDLYKGANPNHRHAGFRPEEIRRIMTQHVGPGGWELVEDEVRDYNGPAWNEYSFLQVYRKTTDGQKRLTPWLNRKGKKICVVCRYGGIGDVLHASSALPALKAQGYHVILITSPVGGELFAADPHVDEIQVHDEGQLPNNEFGGFRADWMRRCDRFINLNETIEVMGLAHPSRAQYYWPKELRCHYFNHNYLQLCHMAAEVPMEKPGLRFWPTPGEQEKMARIRAEMTERVLVWVLQGSGNHKVWPHTVEAIERMVGEDPGLSIVTAGARYALGIENLLRDQPRVCKTILRWSLREVLAFARMADVVVGPETGILHSVAFELGVGKVVFLSHSSRENFSRDWVNTMELVPEGCECYPCHRSYYIRPDLNNDSDCPKDPRTGAAVCQAAISMDRGVETIRGMLDCMAKQRITKQ